MIYLHRLPDRLANVLVRAMASRPYPWHVKIVKLTLVLSFRVTLTSSVRVMLNGPFSSALTIVVTALLKKVVLGPWTTTVMSGLVNSYTKRKSLFRFGARSLNRVAGMVQTKL